MWRFTWCEVAKRDESVSAIDLSPLASCVRLECLHLNNNGFVDEYLGTFPALPRLRELSISGGEMVSLDMRPIKSCCASLEWLSIDGRQLTSLDLMPLASCSRLRVIRLRNLPLTTINLTPLANCSLEDFSMSDCQFETVDLSPLAKHDRLNILAIDNTGLEELDITPLFICENLEHLEIDDDVFVTATLHEILPSVDKQRTPDIALLERRCPKGLEQYLSSIDWM